MDSACARSSLLVTDKEEVVEDDDGKTKRELTGKKLLSVNKGNLAPPDDRKTLIFKLEPATLPVPHDDITVARVKWEGMKDVTARELWQDQGPKKPTPRDDAAQFIRQAMRDPREKPGEFRRRLATEIEAEALAKGIALITLKRAKKELGVHSEQEKGSSDWWWMPPHHWGKRRYWFAGIGSPLRALIG